MKEFNEHYSSTFLAEYTIAFMLLLAILSSLFIKTRANKSFPIHTRITIFLAYMATAGIIILAPTDLALTVVGRRESYNSTDHHRSPTIYEDNSPSIFVLYNVFFWPCILLGSVIMPFQEKFNRCYYFTPSQKILATMKRMFRQYLFFGVLGSAITATLIVNNIFTSIDALLAMAKALSNTLGLTLIVVLLGYGLVELPRMIWRKSLYATQLKTKQMEVAIEFKKFREATIETSMAVGNAIKTQEAVGRMQNETLVHYMEIIMGDCPPQFQKRQCWENRN